MSWDTEAVDTMVGWGRMVDVTPITEFLRSSTCSEFIVDDRLYIPYSMKLPWVLINYWQKEYKVVEFLCRPPVVRCTG